MSLRWSLLMVDWCICLRIPSAYVIILFRFLNFFILPPHYCSLYLYVNITLNLFVCDNAFFIYFEDIICHILLVVKGHDPPKFIPFQWLVLSSAFCDLAVRSFGVLYAYLFSSLLDPSSFQSNFHILLKRSMVVWKAGMFHLTYKHF